MRVMLVCAGLVLAIGCASTEQTEDGTPATSPQPVGPVATNSIPDRSFPRSPGVMPVPAVNGTVESVNREKRYVVLDFLLNRMPEPGENYSVYRAGQKVGEVRISGPSRNTYIAADLIAGEASVGDEVRPD